MRDGMYLAAKEYVAAQDPQHPGVPIPSKFARAAEELTEAIIATPNEKVEVREATQQALRMSREERVSRWQSMLNVLWSSDVSKWAASLIKELASPKTSRAGRRRVPTQNEHDER